jgi:hypothetical protein
MLTTQQTFDKIVERSKDLRKSERPNADNRAFCKVICAYRGEGNLACFAGILISDENYCVTLEGHSATEPRVQRALQLSSVHPGDLALVRRCQTIHDSCSPDEWKSELERAAKEFYVTYR